MFETWDLQLDEDVFGVPVITQTVAVLCFFWGCLLRM